VTRRRATLVLALALLLGATLLPATAGAARPAAAVDADGILRGDLGSGLGRPFAVARRALEAHAARLGVDPAAFRFETVRHSIVGVHIRGREFRGGVPVDATSAAVHVVGGRVWQIEARPSLLAGGPVARAIPREAAVDAALRAFGVTRTLTPPHAERLLVSLPGRLTDVWRVDVHSLAPPVARAALIDAASGVVRGTADRNRYDDGTATVFDPNPIVTARDSSMREPGVDVQGIDTDLDSEALTAQLVRLPVLGYDPDALVTGRLVGPWVDVQAPLPLLPGGTFDYTRGDPRFEALMAYTHIDRVQRYLQSLGFRGEAGVNAEPQTVIALIVPGYDNSMYTTGDDTLTFGSGGVDDAEDAEVILHEYGHAIHDAQVPGWGTTHEGGSMGEGWGDFFAGAYYARTSKGFQDECIADWDATSYSMENPPCLRLLRTGKQYPGSMEGEVHADGEIWSEFLWRLRDRLGCIPKEKGCARRSPAAVASLKTRRALTLVITSHEFLSPTANFGDAIAALRTAARALRQPKWIPLIVKAAKERGLPV
jgi:fungalysin metallopeptidase (M36)